MKICLLLLIGSLTASCNALDLGPEDIYSINNYWNSAEQCERFMIGLHYRVRERAENMLLMGEMRGGMLNTASVTSTGEGAYNVEAVNNNLSEANPGLTNWGNFYTSTRSTTPSTKSRLRASFSTTRPATPIWDSSTDCAPSTTSTCCARGAECPSATSPTC